MAATWLIPRRVEIVQPPSDADAARRGNEVGYDLLFPVRPGEKDQWTGDIDHIFLRGVPRALREGAWVYLKAGHEVFWAAPVLEVLSDAERISDITGERHGRGPNLIVDLARGKHLSIDATAMDTPDGVSWHDRRGVKYVTPGCGAFVKVGPKPPTGAGWARSSIEVAIERALATHLPVDRNARRLRLHDGQPRATVEVDICIPSRNLVVEYDGQYWHRASTARDRAKTSRLLAAGLRVIRIRENLAPLEVGETVQLVDASATPDDIARAVLDAL